MKSSSNNGRNRVKVDSKRAQVLRQKFKQFKEIYKDEQSKFNSPAETDYYIVSKQYLEQWEQFCLSNEVERYQPKPMNVDLMDAGGQLKKNLLELQHYYIVNQKIYNLVKGQSAYEIRRKAVYRGTEKKVPLYLQIIKYLKLQYKDIRNIDYKSMNLSDLKMKQLQFSNEDTIQNLKAQIKNQENLYRVKLRLWVNNHSQTNLQDLYRYIKNKTSSIMSTTYRFDGKGKLVQNLKATLSDLNMKKDDYFIVEICDQYSDYFFKSGDEAKCQGCYKYKTLPIQCGCKVVSYCSESCQEQDKRYHMKDCKYAQQQELKEQIQMKITQDSRLGVVGLSNLGNTCFMNSCLQCLSHTSLLTSYFLNKFYEEEINRDNPLGSQGRLAKNYAKFIKNMWCSSYEVYSPHSLKSAVAKLNPMFSGYAQHDSQQFFSFLVDGIHEDLNRVTKKPYVESTESKNRPDSVVALQSWIAHTQRNQSIIVDLFTGQYKSRVICPKCKLSSITFDPFTTVSLPLPEQEQSKLLKYYILGSSTEKQTRKFGFNYKKLDPNEWLMTASNMQKGSPQDFVFYILTMTQNIYNLSKTGKTEIKNKIEVEQKNVFLLELTPEERKIDEKNRLEIVTRLCQKSSRYQNEYDVLWFKRPFFYEKSTTVALDIVKNIIRYLYGIFTQKKYVNFQTYFQKMLKERPFTLAIQYQKKTQSYMNRKTISYQKSYPLNEDSKRIIDVINQYSLTEYQIDVIFTKQSASYFQFERLKSYTDKVQSKQYKKVSNNKYQKDVSLDECFRAFQEVQQLQPGNEWYCPKCKQHTLATKEMTIYKAPQILILQLKRFKNKGILRKEKNQASVLFPTTLNMKQYLINTQPMSSYTKQLKKQKKYIEPACKIEYNPNSQPIYELYAISNHYGGLGGGHYTAYAKNKDKWYEFNDSSVKKVSEQSIKGSGAYLLFYSRVNNIKIKNDG